jgi:hypothetical protein
MSWKPWSRVDDRGLARYVTPEAKRWLALDVSRFDLGENPEGRRRVVQAIYEALVAKEIRYALEEYHPSAAQQPIRTPPEILEAPREGTCLDLAVLFCGLCLASDLLPILIVIAGHALAAVSLAHGLRDWDGYRPERPLFETGPLTDPDPMRRLLDEGSYLAVECTGLAQSQKLGRAARARFPETIGRRKGVLSFKRAVAAGREQLEFPERPFQFALDIAVAHNAWRIEPYPLEPAALTNIFEILQKASAPLSTYMRLEEFQTLVAERTRDFVGRDFIFAAIDAALRDPEFSSGYILVQGEPGIGKTALMAQLVRQRGYIHHFNIAPQNIRSPKDFLGNVCAQLMVRYGLGYTTLPERALIDSGVLSDLLQEAAARAGGAPVVVLVDALDEAEDRGLPANTNRLYLPAVLPAGIFFVVTTREQHDYRLSVDRRRDIYLKQNDPQNESDVLRYVRAFIAGHRAQMERRMTEWGVDAGEFAQVMQEKSQGNFMYLVHVLRDIRDGQLTRVTVDEIRKLPSGLREYYQRHWRTMKEQDRDRFERLYEPIVCTLAVVQEPVTIVQLTAWTKRITGAALSPRRIKEVIDEWRQFLNEDHSTERAPSYRIYHASFQDFLREEVGLAFYHDAVAQTALDKIQTGRPPMRQALADLTPYELRYLAAHLEAAGRVADLHRLLALETAEGSNAWREAKEARGDMTGFLADVTRAWRLAEAAYTPETAAASQSVGLGMRYALVTSTVNSVAHKIPLPMVSALLERGVWTADQCLVYARQEPDPRKRVNTLAALVPHLPRPTQRDVLREAMAAARAIEWGHERQQALMSLRPLLIESGLLPEALDAAAAIISASAGNVSGEQSESLEILAAQLPEVLFSRAIEVAKQCGWMDRPKALAALAPGVPEALMGEMLEAAAELEFGKGEVLIALAPRLPKRWFEKALGLLLPIEEPDKRAEVLVAYAPRLPDTLKTPALSAALEAARRWPQEAVRADTLATLAPCLSAPLLRQALEVAEAIDYEFQRAEALRALAPYLRGALKQRALLGALEGARATRYEALRIDALVALTSELPSALLSTLRLAAHEFESPAYKAKLLTILAQGLDNPERTDVLSEALQATRAIKEPEGRAGALAALAPLLPELLRSENLSAALAATADCKSETGCRDALAALAPFLTEPLLEQALSIVRALEDPYRRVEALRVLLPYLTGSLLEAASALALSEEEAQAYALSSVAPFFPEGLLPSVLNATARLPQERQRTEVLAALRPRLPEGLLPVALEIVEALRGVEGRTEQLAALAPRLPEPLREAVLRREMARLSQETEEHQAEGLTRIASHLSEALLREALSASRIDDAGEVALALAALAPYLSPEMLEQAVAYARGLLDATPRVFALASLAPHLAEPPRKAVLAEVYAYNRHEALEYATKKSFPRVPSFDKALARLGLELAARGSLEEGLQASAAIEEQQDRMRALVNLALSQPEPLRSRVLDRLLPVALSARRRWSANAGYFFVESLVVAAPYLPESSQATAWKEALLALPTIARQDLRGRAIAALAPHLPEALLPEALAVARAIHEDSADRVEALVALAKRLPTRLKRPVIQKELAAAQGIDNFQFRFYALVRLLPALWEPLRTRVLNEALATAKGFERYHRPGQATAALVPFLSEAQLRAALEVEAKRGDAEVLAVFVKRLAELGYPEEALALARTLTDPFERPKACADVAAHLGKEPPFALVEDVLAAVQAIALDDARAEALTQLLPHLLCLSPTILFALWSKGLHALAGRTRRSLVLDLCVLAPVVPQLGGTNAAAETFCAIQDVARWWP